MTGLPAPEGLGPSSPHRIGGHPLQGRRTVLHPPNHQLLPRAPALRPGAARPPMPSPAAAQEPSPGPCGCPHGPLSTKPSPAGILPKSHTSAARLLLPRALCCKRSLCGLEPWPLPPGPTRCSCHTAGRDCGSRLTGTQGARGSRKPEASLQFQPNAQPSTPTPSSRGCSRTSVSLSDPPVHAPCSPSLTSAFALKATHGRGTAPKML